ncbi:MAG: sugar phosphate isomerase/epimerase [Labilibaculum sp.]|nr:sugar phosphate isomerase/epimerase [Labilibaculum sp.]
MKKRSLKKTFRCLLILFTFYLSNNYVFSQISHGITSAGTSFKIGILSSSLPLSKSDELLQVISRLDIHYLCVNPKHLPVKSTNEEIVAFKAQLSEAGIEAYSVGLIYMRSKEKVDQAFEYARRVGVEMIIGAPAYELLPYVEQKVKEYNIKLAIHNHGGDIDLYPNADDVMKHIKNLDPRIGVCLDIGHNLRANSDPIEDLKKYHNRILDIQIKDITAANKSGRTCEMGHGIIDIPAFVRTLDKVKYRKICSIEFEKDRRDPVAGIAESLGYLRGVIRVLIK